MAHGCTSSPCSVHAIPKIVAFYVIFVSGICSRIAPALSFQHSLPPVVVFGVRRVRDQASCHGVSVAQVANVASQFKRLKMSGRDNDETTNININDDDANNVSDSTSTGRTRRRQRIRERVSDLARRIVLAPIHAASSITPMPQAVASVLKDATLNAVDMAVEEGKRDNQGYCL